MGDFDAGTLNGEPVAFQTTVHGPVVGYATVDGEKVAISSQALELRQGLARPALQPPALQRPGAQPEVVLQGGVADAADVQLVLHRRQAHRDVHGGPAADPHQARRPGPADHGHRQVRVDRASSRKTGTSAGHRPERRDDHQLEPDHRQGLRRGRRRVGPQRLGRPRRPAEQEPRPARDQEGQVDAGVGDLGDERRGDPGRAGDRHRAAAASACSRAPRPRRRRPQQMLDADGRLEAARRQPPRPRPRRQDRRSRRRDRWTAPGRRSPTRSWRRSSAPQLDELNSLFSRFNLPPGGQYDGWYQYFDRDIRDLLGHEGRSRRSRTATAATASSRPARRRSGTRSRPRARSSPPSRAPPTRRRGARTRPRADHASRRACSTTTMRYTNRPSGIQQVISFDGHR